MVPNMRGFMFGISRYQFEFYAQCLLPKLRVMFTFVVLDHVAIRAFDARDLYGANPLYWTQTADGVCWLYNCGRLTGVRVYRAVDL